MVHQEPPQSILSRIQGEFIEMPGLRLTRAQAARLWALSRATSDQMLEQLVARGILREVEDGTFVLSARDDLQRVRGFRRVS